MGIEKLNQEMIAKLEQEISSIKSRDDQIQLQNTNLKKLEEQCLSELKSVNELFPIWKFWEICFDNKRIAGFSSLRAHIIETSIKDLNVVLQG